MVRDTSAQDRLIEFGGNQSSRVKLLLTLAGVVLVAGLVAWLTSTFLRRGSSIDRGSLLIEQVTLGGFVHDVVAEGTVIAAIKPTMYAQESGILSLLVKPGQIVSKGQVLAEISNAELTSELERAQVAVDLLTAKRRQVELENKSQRALLQEEIRAAQMEHLSAERNFKRAKYAYDAGAYAEIQMLEMQDRLEKAKSALDSAGKVFELKDQILRQSAQSADAELLERRLAVQRLQERLNGLLIKAPVDGQIGKLAVEDKDVVAKNAPIATIIDLSALQVEVRVPENKSRYLRIGLPVEIDVNGKKISAVVDAIYPEVSAGSIAVRISFKERSNLDLRQNQRVVSRIIFERLEDVKTVPRGSWIEDFGGNFIYVVEDDVATKRLVVLGARGDSQVVIQRGVEIGERVVVNSVRQRAESERFRITD